MGILAIWALAGAAWAGEFAVLHTGFRIEIERHEISAGVARLFTRDGVIELPVSAIAAFEAAERAPEPVRAPPQPDAIVAPPPPATSKAPRELVEEAAHRNGLPPAILHSVARVESAYRADAVSPKGAIGVMQLMPRTAAMLNADPRDPAENIEAGARHLRDLLIRYNGETRKALAAYNAGAGAVERYGGVPPYTETRNYVEKVLRLFHRLSEQNQDQR
jgi:soluble lytic murein transglycosylase-like protein